MSVVVKVPYPPNLRFNEKEQAYYNKNKQYVDESVKDELAREELYKKNKYRSVVVIYKKQITGDVVYKRVAQIEWDTGISKDRPYTYNEGFVMEKIKKIKEKYANETDENKKATLKRTLVGLMPKLQQARDVDKVEAVTIPREIAGMEEYDTIDRGVLERRRDKQNKILHQHLREKREKEREEEQLAEEARLKKIEDDKIVETTLRAEEKLIPQRKQFKKEIIDPTLKETGITGRINLKSIDVENRTALYYPTQNIWYNPDPKEGRSFRIRNPEPNERATGDEFLGQAEYILKKELVKLLLYKKIGETANHFKKDLKEWLDMDATIGLDDEYEYYEFNRSSGILSYTDYNWKYGVIYTTKLPKKEELMKNKWKEPIKVQLFITSKFYEDNFFLQTLDKIEKTGKGIASYSNPKIAKKNAVKYLGKNVVFKPSTKKDKKFMVLNPDTNKFIHFGQLGFEDFTKHQDTKRQTSYLNRTGNMRGDWKDDKYSANNLAREILWR